jgi:hypothetical protein
MRFSYYMLTSRQGEFRGCKCQITATDIHVQYRDEKLLNDGIETLKELQNIYDHFDKYVTEPDINCASSRNTDAVAIDKKTAYDMGEQFCANLDPSKETKKDLTTKDIGVSSHGDFIFHFEYKPGDKCYSNCKDTIRKMVCKCSTNDLRPLFKLWNYQLMVEP